MHLFASTQKLTVSQPITEVATGQILLIFGNPLNCSASNYRRGNGIGVGSDWLPTSPFSIYCSTSARTFRGLERFILIIDTTGLVNKKMVLHRLFYRYSTMSQKPDQRIVHSLADWCHNLEQSTGSPADHHRHHRHHVRSQALPSRLPAVPPPAASGDGTARSPFRPESTDP